MTLSAEIERDIARVQRSPSVDAILEVLSRTTGLRVGLIARVAEDSWTACAVRDEAEFGLEPGDQLELATTY